MDLRTTLVELMMIPGLSGHEERVRRRIAALLSEAGLDSRSDVLGNLMTTLPGNPDRPSVMLFTHMDQLGFIVRRIEDGGFIRVERLGGVPERALASQPVTLCVGEGRDVPGVIANKSHHATAADEKYRVVPYREIYVDAGFRSEAEAEMAGIKVGTPVVYTPRVSELANGRIAGTSVDDRAGCAVLLEVAKELANHTNRPTVHVVFSTQEEFNLRGALTAAQALQPAIAIQIDLMLATDTPDMGGDFGDVALGGGPAVSLYSFHGRGTLNGVIPHPAMVRLFEQAAAAAEINLQRTATVGVLTDLSYVQTVGEGVAAIDVGFPMRYSHASNEVCDPGDLRDLSRLLVAAISGIDAAFDLERA